MLEFVFTMFYDEIRSFINSRESKQTVNPDAESETYFRSYYYRWVADCSNVKVLRIGSMQFLKTIIEGDHE